MATELGNMFLQGLKDRKEFKAASTNQARNDWQAARAGQSATPLSEFLSSDNTRYARDVIGWDRAQEMRKKAEAADVGAVPPSSGQWDRRYNYTTNEMEWLPKESGNFWRANKDELIQMGGFIAGSLVGAPMLGYSLAKTGRDIYKMRDARRDFKDQKRDWQHQQMLDDEAARRLGPQRGNLFKNIGEGTVEWATKDVERNKRKGTYERGAV